MNWLLEQIFESSVWFSVLGVPVVNWLLEQIFESIRQVHNEAVEL